MRCHRLLSLACLAILALSVSRSSSAESSERSVDQVIRDATGLRFAVAESIIRRSIISTNTPYGFKVKSIDAGSPGAQAGLRKGDILLEWDGRPIKSRKDLAKWIDQAREAAGVVEVPIKYARLKERRRALDRKPWVEHEGTMRLPR